MKIKGIVKWFRPDKGYGFITADHREVFVHYTQINKEGFKTLTPGNHVYFELYETDPGRYEAKNVDLE